MKSWHKTAAIAVLALGLAIAGGITARHSGHPTSEDLFQRVSDRLACRCGCNQNLTACNHHPCGSADPMREQIRASIDAGKNEEAIIQAFVQQNGAVILAAPPAQGFNLAAWIMPFAALLLGGVVIFRVVRRWRPAPAKAGAPESGAQAGPATADPQRQALIERYARAIDEELDREP